MKFSVILFLSLTALFSVQSKAYDINEYHFCIEHPALCTQNKRVTLPLADVFLDRLGERVKELKFWLNTYGSNSLPPPTDSKLYQKWKLIQQYPRYSPLSFSEFSDQEFENFLNLIIISRPQKYKMAFWFKTLAEFLIRDSNFLKIEPSLAQFKNINSKEWGVVAEMLSAEGLDQFEHLKPLKPNFLLYLNLASENHIAIKQALNHLVAFQTQLASNHSTDPQSLFLALTNEKLIELSSTESSHYSNLLHEPNEDHAPWRLSELHHEGFTPLEFNLWNYPFPIFDENDSLKTVRIVYNPMAGPLISIEGYFIAAKNKTLTIQSKEGILQHYPVDGKNKILHAFIQRNQKDYSLAEFYNDFKQYNQGHHISFTDCGKILNSLKIIDDLFTIVY